MDWSWEKEFIQVNPSVRHSNYLSFPLISDTNKGSMGMGSSTGQSFSLY